jgi:hypothetical protein
MSLFFAIVFFEKKDAKQQFPVATVAGKCKINIDFITGKYKVEKI